MAKQEECDAVLKDIKEKIELFNFKTTDFKGVLATRKKLGTATPKITAGVPPFGGPA